VKIFILTEKMEGWSDAKVFVENIKKGANHRTLCQLVGYVSFPPIFNVVKELLKDPNINVNYGRSGDLFTPLMHACLFANSTSSLECVKLLLANKRVKVNRRDYKENTALFWNVKYGSGIDVTRALLSHRDIDPNVGTNVFHCAIALQGDDTTYIRELLRYKSLDVNDRLYFDDSRSPFATCCRQIHRYSEYLEIAKCILAHKTYDPRGHDEDGDTDLMEAMQFGDVECVRMILNHPLFNSVNAREIETKQTALYTCVASKQGTEKLQLLLDCPDIDVNLSDKEGWSPLAYAARYHGQDTSYIDLLLAHKDIHVNAQDQNGWTPLMNAARNVCSGESSMAILKALLRHRNIKPNIENNKGSYALSFATRIPDFEAVAALLDHRKTVGTKRVVYTAFEGVSEDLLFALISMLVKSKKVDISNIWSQIEKRKFALDGTCGKLFSLLLSLLNNDEIETLELPCTCQTPERWKSLMEYSLTHCRSLKKVTVHECVTSRQWLIPKVFESFSICYFHYRKGFLSDIFTADESSRYDKILYNNRDARKKCYTATIFSILAFKKLVGKEVTKMIGRAVWATRGTKDWRSDK